MGAFASNVERDRARAIIGNLGEAITYRGSDGDIATIGYVERADDLFGSETATTDVRYVATLLIEDVGTVRRGDRIIDADGVEWTLMEEQPSLDPWISDWTCERSA